MHLKRYKRKTVQDALRAVREDLGPQALVLSTRLVPAPGVRGWLGARAVEVTAAADRLPMSDDRHLDTRRQAGSAVTAQRGEEGIAARLEASGIDPEFAREVARSQPSNGRRGTTLDSLRRTLADRLESL